MGSSRFIIIILFIIYSCNNEVTYNFDESIFRTSNHNHKFVINNPSHFNYAFYSFTNTGIEDFHLIGKNNIIITDEDEKKVVEKNVFINYKDVNTYENNEEQDSLLNIKNELDGFKRSKFWYSINNSIKANALFVESTHKKKFNREIVLLANQIVNGNSYFPLKKNKKYFIQINIDFDSTVIKEYLTPADINYLRKNNIKIFHGELQTERIPVIVD